MENTTNQTAENTVTAPVVATKKTTVKKAATKKTTAAAKPVAKKTVAVEAKIDTTKAVNAVTEAANEVQATSKEIKNAVVKTVADVNKKVTSTVNDVNKKVTTSVKKMNKEVMETASEISTTATKLANEVVENLQVNERLATVKDVVKNPNKHALKAADELIDAVEKNTIKWQRVADKAVTTGLKLATMQEELIFSSLEAVKTHVGTTATRVKNLFGSEAAKAKSTKKA